MVPRTSDDSVLSWRGFDIEVRGIPLIVLLDEYCIRQYMLYTLV